MAAQQGECTRRYQTVHFKMVNSILVDYILTFEVHELQKKKKQE